MNERGNESVNKEEEKNSKKQTSEQVATSGGNDGEHFLISF